jgi:hypothetical protein
VPATTSAAVAATHDLAKKADDFMETKYEKEASLMKRLDCVLQAHALIEGDGRRYKK